MRPSLTIPLLLVLSLGPGCRQATEAPAAAPALVAPAPPKPEPTLLGAGSEAFRVLALETCEAIVDREAHKPRSHFPAETQRVWAWFSVRNTQSRGHVVVRWGRQAPFDRELRIHVGQNPRWRSWAPLELGASPEGWWTVELASPEGEMMASRRFFVEGAAPLGGQDATPR